MLAVLVLDAQQALIKYVELFRSTVGKRALDLADVPVLDHLVVASADKLSAGDGDLSAVHASSEVDDAAAED